MTSIIIAALGVAVCLAATAVSLCILWRAEHARLLACRERYKNLWISHGILDGARLRAVHALDSAEAKIARLTPLAEIGLRVEGQPRDEHGRFKAKAK